MSNEYNVKLLVKQTKLNAKDALSHNKKYSGFKDLLKDNIPESLVDYNGNAYDISSVFHDTNWSSNNKTESQKSSQKFSQIETNANLELYKNAKLVPHEDASGTTHKLWTVYDDASNNLLEHMINYKFDNSGSYLPMLTYYNGSSYVESTMFSDPLWWLIDNENHAISFFNTDSVLNGGTVNISAGSANPPKLTFYRYIGKTKVNNKLSVEGDISCNYVYATEINSNYNTGANVFLDHSSHGYLGINNVKKCWWNSSAFGPQGAHSKNFGSGGEPWDNIYCSTLNLSKSSNSTANVGRIQPKFTDGTSHQDAKCCLDFSTGSSNIFAMRINNGNVGIGTSSPGAKLEVNGDISCNEVIVSGTTLTNRLTQVDTSCNDLSGVVTTNIGNIASNESNISTNTSNISTNTTNISTNTTNISTNTSNISTNTTNISTNTSNISTNTSNISTNTSNISTNTNNKAPINNPTFTSDLNINNTNGGLLIRTTDTNYNRIKSEQGNNSTAGKDLLITSGDRGGIAPDIYIKTDGNVGIGTASPGLAVETPTFPTKLDISGGGLRTTTNGTGLKIEGYHIGRSDYNSDWAGGSMYIQHYSQGNLLLCSGSSSGNIGIGTETPGAKLDIMSDSDGHCLFTRSSGNDGNKENIIFGQSNGYAYSYSIKATGTSQSGSSLVFKSFDARSDQMTVTDELLRINRYGSLDIRGFQVTFGHGQSSLTDCHINLKTTGLDFGNGRDSHIYIYRNGTAIWAMYCWGVNNASSSNKTVAQVRFSRNSDGSLHTFLNVNPYTGTVTTPANGATSDDRVKHNEVDISNSLLTIRKLKPVKYFKNTDEKIYDKNHNFALDQNGNPLDDSGNIIKINIIKESGFISQEIKKIDELKHLVIGEEYDISGNETIMGLNYNGIIPYNTSAIQEIDHIQQLEQTKLTAAETEITTLKSTVETQQTTINTLQSTLAALEARIAALENP